MAFTISCGFFCPFFFSPSIVPITTFLPPVAGLLAQPATKTVVAATQRTIRGVRFICSSLRMRAGLVFNYDMAPPQQVPVARPSPAKRRPEAPLCVVVNPQEVLQRLEAAAYFLRNLSTRPAVSTI